MPLISTYYNTLIDLAMALYYNYGKNRHFTLSYLELKIVGNIKEKEEKETFNKLGKKEPYEKTSL